MMFTRDQQPAESTDLSLRNSSPVSKHYYPAVTWNIDISYLPSCICVYNCIYIYVHMMLRMGYKTMVQVDLGLLWFMDVYSRAINRTWEPRF